MFGIQTICLRNSNNRYLNREQATAVKGRGWAGNLASVEDLWSRRYSKTIEDPHGDGDGPGPPHLGHLPVTKSYLFQFHCKAGVHCQNTAARGQ
ncbi:MAG: hypothetical protein CMJ81_03060 [Planctomycetaceae bacterium]|nr:hypothetical protein [Planctomycetaceae bacterium]MBP61900.1 hypothetical protein [Planctomycetaceae bacterium]